MDGLGLYQELSAKTALLDRAVSELRARGTALAQAERDYKVAAAKRILALRDDGVPVTIIGDLVRGDEEVSMLRFKRDCADVVYRSALEAINALKLEIRLINEQVSREMGRPGMG